MSLKSLKSFTGIIFNTRAVGRREIRDEKRHKRNKRRRGQNRCVHPEEVHAKAAVVPQLLPCTDVGIYRCISTSLITDCIMHVAHNGRPKVDLPLLCPPPDTMTRATDKHSHLHTLPFVYSKPPPSASSLKSLKSLMSL